ncbi:NMCC_0638 family (lipo)protein [Nitrospirillum sp. BR 11828]|uniref:NMCC_0638 family (lipo)protein n=1 Tax=Nitrospirillum sp. BR 11828 TaxID=3104325 RepID=UPI002ACA0F60|nr:hypothetical protein [Nitrospirillum sp. BR 11828]MDZ5647857.1 hypothetical protein [Nitrospirillum sp. BR 11828]
MTWAWKAAAGAVMIVGALIHGVAAQEATPQPPPVQLPDPSPEDVAAATELAEVFEDFCLKRFPDDEAVKAGAQDLTAMTPDQVKGILKDDPGIGWYKKTPLALYKITLELPPYHACAVRRMTANGIPTVKPYLAAITAFAAAQGRPLQRQQAQKMNLPTGPTVTIFPQAIADATGQRVQTQFMVLLTNYHHQYGGEDYVGGVGLEVRYVRQEKQP